MRKREKYAMRFGCEGVNIIDKANLNYLYGNTDSPYWPGKTRRELFSV